MAQQRTRLDERLVADGAAESRSIAQRLIMAGAVKVDGHVVDKSSKQVLSTAAVEVAAPPRFVSRGGDKLENAISDLGPRLEELGLDVRGVQAIDVGISTGGFTDCLLQRGAARVVGVDVGYGQVHQRLRDDERVVVMERTNARHLQPGDLPFAPELLVCDASFISLKTVLPAPIALMREGFWGLVLCKPQFEAGKERLRRAGRGGVIRDVEIRDEILAETVAAVEALGVAVEEVVQAHPPGPKGNVEYVLLIRHRAGLSPS